MENILINPLPEVKTRSGRTKYAIEVSCNCGWGTKGDNTFSMEHLVDWANKMAKWHNDREHNN